MKNFGLLVLMTLALLGCDKLNKADSALDSVAQMNTKMGEMNDGLLNTKEAVRLQKMTLCLDAMRTDYALERLFPVPTEIMPYARTFSEAATAHELVELTYLWLKEIDEITPLKKVGEDGAEVDFTAAEQARTLSQKFGRFQALSAIAGFIPAQTLDQIVHEEILGSGRYRESALNLLMLRAVFLRQVLLEESILKKGKFASVGAAEVAVDYMSSVEKIARFPFVNEISLQTTGLTGPAGYNGSISNADLKMDADTLGFLTSGWSKIADAIENGLPIEIRNNTADPAVNKATQERDLNRKAKALSTVRAAAQAWKKVP